MGADIIALILTSVSALGAAGAAVATFWEARETRKAAEGERLNRFLEKYSETEMLRALRRLRNLEHIHGKGFAEKWKRSLDKEEPKAMEVELARRHVSHYFQRALYLYETGYVSERFVKAVGSYGGIDILYEIVEPLEYELNSDYDRTIFEKLRKICPPSPKIGRLKKPQPIP